MHSSSLGARPGGFLCRHKLSSQCALHKHHNLNNLGIQQEIWQNLFRKIDFAFETIQKNQFSDPQKPEKSISIRKNRFSLCRGGYTPYVHVQFHIYVHAYCGLKMQQKSIKHFHMYTINPLLEGRWKQYHMNKKHA